MQECSKNALQLKQAHFGIPNNSIFNIFGGLPKFSGFVYCPPSYGTEFESRSSTTILYSTLREEENEIYAIRSLLYQWLVKSDVPFLIVWIGI